ncbi:uncharacterized protein LOC130710596 [Lotus japonicus]|uniref:uncharacterized protein LOC130710596 n=1 Tax=Lotus japonicus TaxID=34305 RepID=UPI002585C1BF|nr:uncharacterized protein LOC130710596 [Lotus japonicus]
MSFSSGNGSHDKTHHDIAEQESAKIRRLKRRLVLAERRPNKAHKVLTPCSGSQSNILQTSFSCDKDYNGYGKRSLDAQGSTIVGRNFVGKENIYGRAINDCVVNLMSSFDDVASPVLEFMESTQSHVSNLTQSTPLNGHMSRVEYLDIGDPTWKCEYCGALMWYDERTVKAKRPDEPEFSLCCSSGKVQLPLMLDPPLTLRHLLFYKDTKQSKHFRENIRAYNAAFNFTSMGAKVDREVNTGRGPRVFKISGQNYHSIGDLTPPEGHRPKFAQLYIYDTANEVENRRALFRTSDSEFMLHSNIIQMLKDMLDKDNVWAEAFRMARDVFDVHEDENFSLKLIFDRQSDGRTYNMPTVLEYPLLFAYGEDGYRSGVLHRGLDLEEWISKPAYNTVTIREFFAFRLQTRENEPETLLHAGKLFQQFIVDGYTMIEAHRMCYYRRNQKKFRAGSYKDVNSAVDHGITESSSSGTRILLPSSFIGGRRYMNQHYYDAMAICHKLGYPDLFITFTCNQNWVEINRFLTKKRLRPEDRPDVVTRVFKIKLQQLMEELKSGTLFGDVIAVVYTIEFQKRGLPHAHILLFLRNKSPNHSHIDKIISAEIPDPNQQPLLYERVKTSMMHGPCGSDNVKSPCMKDGKCSKFFPKPYVESTTLDEEGFPVYRRRNDGRTVKKGNIELDNRYVGPYNPTLLLKYDSHINVEWCNQSGSIKYLFKYISKGHDRIIAGIHDKNKEVDEIKMYYDCRYLSPCESVWRTFGFEIVHREPAVERLSFHLPGEQSVLYEDDEPLDVVLDKVGSKGTMQINGSQGSPVEALAECIM